VSKKLLEKSKDSGHTQNYQMFVSSIMSKICPKSLKYEWAQVASQLIRLVSAVVVHGEIPVSMDSMIRLHLHACYYYSYMQYLCEVFCANTCYS